MLFSYVCHMYVAPTLRSLPLSLLSLSLTAQVDRVEVLAQSSNSRHKRRSSPVQACSRFAVGGINFLLGRNWRRTLASVAHRGSGGSGGKGAERPMFERALTLSRVSVPRGCQAQNYLLIDGAVLHSSITCTTCLDLRFPHLLGNSCPTCCFVFGIRFETHHRRHPSRTFYTLGAHFQLGYVDKLFFRGGDTGAAPALCR